MPCGDELCELGETPFNCTIDCAPCEDGQCVAPESPETCLADCGWCGDGYCSQAENDGLDADCPKDCLAACGDGVCEGGESVESCVADCGDCGDDICGPGELDGGCPADCPLDCGDGLCGLLETKTNCPTDCVPCGDGTCEAGENPWACAADCMLCGDGKCVEPETPEVCSADCVTPCGNGLCEGAENPEDCPLDCSWCGDGVCGFSETGPTCPPDCWNGCGNGECQVAFGEDAGNCPADCVYDSDLDGLLDDEDNCRYVPNPEQSDVDLDGLGDACDPDDDGDGELDVTDCSPDDPEVSHLAFDGCDGADNDCDGEVDEEDCDDGDSCTADSCGGAEGCVHEPVPEGEPCLDGEPGYCDNGGECVCLSTCTGKACGDNGCGGSCGDCSDNEMCTEVGHCVCEFGECGGNCCGEGYACFPDGVCCIPDCEGKECGDDGCDGECGECIGDQEECGDGLCICMPACAEGQCGDDGCGGSCPECTGLQEECLAGLCTCIPDCAGEVCGDDGCGGSCGVCPECGNGEVEEGEECDDGNDFTWDGCDQCVIAEFQLNYFASGGQTSPDVAVFSSGGFVVTWEVEEEESTDLDVYARLFDAEGQPAGWEFTVNSVVAGNQRKPAVAAWGYGAFIVVWESEGHDGDGYGVFGQLFLPGGDKIATEFQINTSTAFDQMNPAVTVGLGPAFLVAWQCDGFFSGSAGNYEICARAYDSDPDWVGDDFLVNEYKMFDELAPALDAWGNGDYVGVWDQEATGGQGFDLTGRIFGPDGTKQEIEFTVTYPVTGSQRNADVAVADPGFLVVWDSDNAEDGDGHSIRGRFWTEEDAYSGGDKFVVNTTSPGNQTLPSAVAFPGDVNKDEFVVAWQSQPNVDSAWEIRSRRVDSAGIPNATDFAVHGTNADWDRTLAAAAAFMDGSFILVWQSCPVFWQGSETGQDGDGCGIFAQRFNPDGTKMYR